MKKRSIQRPSRTKSRVLAILDLVQVDFIDIPTKIRGKYPFKHGEVLLYLGEIGQMPGHAVVVNKKGQTFWGYHTEHFVRVPENEA